MKAPTSEHTATISGGERAFPLFLLLAFVVLTLLVLRFWFVTDDAYISFRYAANWAEGNGLRYNLGVEPPVEGFSNFLWTAVLAGVRLLGGDMAVAAPWISLGLSLLLLWRIARFLARTIRRAAPAGGETAPDIEPAVAGILFVALFPPYAVYSTSGLETMLFCALLFTAFEQLLGTSPARGATAGVVAGLLALTRPEGLVWALALAGLYVAPRIVRRERVLDRPLLRYTLVLIALTLIFLAARLLYFERWLPNTAYAKVGFSWLIVKRGLLYVSHFGLTFVTPTLCCLAIPWLVLRGKAPAPIWQAAAVLAGFVLYATLTGGDFMVMGRFLAPATPFLALLVAALYGAFSHRTARLPRPALRILLAAFLAAQLLPAFDLDLMPAAVRKTLRFRWNDSENRSEFQQWRYMNDNCKKWEAAGKALAAAYPSKNDSLLCSNIGAIGYYSRLFIIDECGLIDPHVAKRVRPANAPRLSAGHDKRLPSGYFLKHKPTIFQTLVINNHEIPILLERFAQGGLPPGYRIKTLPLDRIEGAPPQSTLIVITRRAEKSD